MPCPVCYDDDADTLVCENAHTLCGGCYKTMMSHDRSANKNCAECRTPMFVWDNPILNPVRAERAPPAAVPEWTRPRCGVCSQEGHNRSTCPHRVFRPFVPGPGRRCGICRVVGHTRSRCPDRRAITQSVIAALVAENAIEEEWAERERRRRERERARNIRAAAAQERAAFAAAADALVPDALDDLVEAIEAMGAMGAIEIDLIDL